MMQIPIKSILEIESCLFFTGTFSGPSGISTTPMIRISARIYPFNHKPTDPSSAPVVTFEAALSPDASTVLMDEIDRVLGEMVDHEHEQMVDTDDPDDVM